MQLSSQMIIHSFLVDLAQRNNIALRELLTASTGKLRDKFSTTDLAGV